MKMYTDLQLEFSLSVEWMLHKKFNWYLFKFETKYKKFEIASYKL